MVEGSHTPRNTDTKEDIDGVGAGDVAHGGVGGLVLNGSRLRGEGVGYRGSQGDNGVGAVLKVDEAAEMTGNVTDDGSADTDSADRDDKGRVAGIDSCGGNEGEDEFP